MADRELPAGPPVGPTPVVVHETARALLAEILQITMDRMNHGQGVSSWEAYTLGKVAAVASKYPGVLPEGDGGS